MFLPKLSFLSFLLASSGAAAVSIDAHYPHDPHTLSGCLSQFRIETLLPSSANFSTAIQPYNLRTGLGWVPTALVLPHTPQEVAAAIRCANKFNIKVAARSGGHSYGAYGLGGQNGSLVIDLQNFNMLSVDPKTQIATIGAGVRLGDIATYLYNNGKRALPHGMCGGVGLGGHILHGGFGYTSRMWGITLDTVLSITAVISTGQILTITSVSNPDLFWALRGAGSSFAIATSFQLQTQPAPSNAIIFNYTFPSSTSIPDKVSLFEKAQEFAATAPPELALRLMTRTASFPIVAEWQFVGAYWGSRGKFNEVIAPLLAAWPADTHAEISEQKWLQALDTFAMSSIVPPHPYNIHDTFFAKSLTTSVPISNGSLSSFFTFLRDNSNAPVTWWVLGDLYGGKYSKIASKGPEDASYAGRDALWTFQLYSVPKDFIPPYPSDGVEFMGRMHDSMTKVDGSSNWGAYPNYVDPTLAPREAHRLYYGSQYDRLREIKRRCDPEMRFWNPQAIGVE